MTDFAYDVLQKKRIASQAVHRKGTKGRKGCSLPSDNLTQKQWKEKNGKVYSVNLRQPMTWKNFKSLSPNLQKEYVTSLVRNYDATYHEMAQMMGVKNCTLYEYFRTHGLTVPDIRSGKSKRPRSGEIAWARFCQGFAGRDEPEETETAPETGGKEEPEKPEKLVESLALSVPEKSETPDSSMTPTPLPAEEKTEASVMDSFAITLRGSVKPEDVFNTIRHISCGEPLRGRVTITFSADGGGGDV